MGDEVRSAAVDRLGPQAAAFFTPHGPRWLLDLWAANEAQLGAAGVPAAAVARSGHCTICGGTDFPSHRRDGEAAGRFAAFIAGNGPAAPAGLEPDVGG